jgi:hypothetical protein
LSTRRQRFDDIHLKAAFDHGFDAVLAATAARDRLDEQLRAIRPSQTMKAKGFPGAPDDCECR